MKIENLLEGVKLEKFKLYNQIIENLEDLQLNKDQIQDILKIFDRSFTKFVEKSLNLKKFKKFKDPIQESIKKTSISEYIEDLEEKLVKGICRLKINKDLKNIFIRNLSINIEKPKIYGSLYQFIINFPILKPILELYREMDYIEGLQKINLSYDNTRKLEAVINSHPLLMGIYRDEFYRILSWKQWDLAYLNENIEKYNSYLEMGFTERFGLQETFREFISDLTSHKESRLKERQPSHF